MRGRPALKIRCRVCGIEQDAIAFRVNATTGKRQRSKSDTCCNCRAEARTDEFTTAVWDWAAALCKGTGQSVAHARSEDSRVPPWTGQLDAVGVRALFILQGRRCAFTQWPLMVPDSYTRLTRGSTLETWSRLLKPEAAGRVPVIIRVCPDGGWEPGNVVLVARAVAPIVDYAGSMEKARQLLGELRSPTIPTADTVAKVRDAALAELKTEYLNERERVKQAYEHVKEADKALDQFM